MALAQYMVSSDEELEKLLRNALAMHEEVLLEGREEIPEESLGFVYGTEVGERDLRTILQNIPLAEPPAEQLTCLIRAIVCSQIFCEGNKRFATVFSNYHLRGLGLSLVADPEDLKRVLSSLVGKCPKIPLPADDLLVRDKAYEYVREWIESETGKLKAS